MAGVATLALNELSFRMRQRSGMSAVWQRTSGMLGIIGPASMLILAERLDPEQAVCAVWWLTGLAGLHYAGRRWAEQQGAMVEAAERQAEIARSIRLIPRSDPGGGRWSIWTAMGVDWWAARLPASGRRGRYWRG